MTTALPLTVLRRPEHLRSDDSRVMARLFLPSDGRIKKVIDRVMGLHADEVNTMLSDVLRGFTGRHFDLGEVLKDHFEAVRHYCEAPDRLTHEQQMLIGAYFTMEYAVESAALFNPSMVLHPDQSDLPDGSVRFIMSLRATGEGHVSSVVFRTGTLDQQGQINFDPLRPHIRAARLVHDRYFDKHTFFLKLIEMGAYTSEAEEALNSLGDHFTFNELEQRINDTRHEDVNAETHQETVENVLWLARSNYHLRMPQDAPPSEVVIFPTTENDSRGIEDVRLVRFHDQEQDRHTYFGTFTAYNGFRSLPMLFETDDFRLIKVHTLNGKYAQNKGMALFPRKINDWYMMISRIDGENMYLMWSDNVHFWNDAELLVAPKYPWEFMQIGNCGSPIETEKGWLLLTHGVGPMRQYCIGALLLDLQDPSKVIGQLEQPLLAPNEAERDGYVPNVVYSCGGMVHGDQLVIPYAMSDFAVSFATVGLDDLLNQFK